MDTKNPISPKAQVKLDEAILALVAFIHSLVSDLDKAKQIELAGLIQQLIVTAVETTLPETE